MRELYAWPWVQARVEETAAFWRGAAGAAAIPGRQFDTREQRRRERACDEALREAEREAGSAARDGFDSDGSGAKGRSRADRPASQERLTELFARFADLALGLRPEAVHLLTGNFLPVGMQLARWARHFDPQLSMAEITQACRNAWTACGLQPLLGVPFQLTPSILGYSLLYPYSDNYLDRPELEAAAKLRFSEHFRERLLSDSVIASDSREGFIWKLVELIEEQYPRAAFPDVYACLLAIHRAQEASMEQLTAKEWGEEEILHTSCAKGGSSVLADASLARGWLTDGESRFAFAWGVLLQLGDDLQDVQEDLSSGSATIFTHAIRMGRPLDEPAMQLLAFSQWVADQMDQLPHGTEELKSLLRTSWLYLIVGAVACANEFFTPGLLRQAERCSPFRFDFLRERQQRLVGRGGLYGKFFQTFIAAPEAGEQAALFAGGSRSATVMGPV